MSHTSILQIYRQLLAAYGSQDWWPAESPFEVMVGAVLTQNTAWPNVEKAIERIKQADALSPEALTTMAAQEVADLIRPSGYFNIKAERLRALCTWYIRQGGHAGCQSMDSGLLRHSVLQVKGIGPETADDILLYAFQRPVFVIDAYTRRIFSRIGLIEGDEGYETLRNLFEAAIGPVLETCNEYHALIVRHAKVACRKQPDCENCCLSGLCVTSTPDLSSQYALMRGSRQLG